MGNSNRRRVLKEERLKNGLCVHCGLVPHLKNKHGCKKCLHKLVIRTNKYVKNNKDKIIAYHKSVRKQVIEKYGGICACCGESNWCFLTIDHINGDGGEERKALYGSQSGNSKRWFFKLRREPLRKDLRVLCFNCNNAICHCGICPHEQSKKVDQETIS